MAVVLVTVAAAGRTADLAVPAGPPVADLLDELAGAVLGAAATGAWALAAADGVPLPPERSLAACGVPDGARLTLTADPPGPSPTPFPAAGSTLGSDAALSPRGSGVVLDAHPPPAWPVLERVAAALGAAARRGAGAGPGPAARVAASWRATRYQRRLEAAVDVPVPTRCACVAVLSAAPGVGGTTVAVLLAAALGGGRDATVAVDAHPGPGSLSGTLGPGPEVFADDLLDVLEHPALTWPELRAALGWPGFGPAVLAGRPEDGQAGHAGDRPGRPGCCRSAGPLDEPGWVRVLHGLACHATVVVVDCGPDLAAPAARAAIAAADQLVLVTGAQVPGPLPGLAGRPAGPGQPVTVVVSRPAADLDAGQALDQAPWARGAFLLPDDPAGPAALGPGPFAWEQVPARWRRQAYELAFQLVSDWPALGLAALAQPAPSA